MSELINIFKNVINVISSLLNFLWNEILSFVYLIRSAPTFVQFFTSSFSVLPSVILPFCVLSLSIYLLYLLISRGS